MAMMMNISESQKSEERHPQKFTGNAPSVGRVQAGEPGGASGKKDPASEGRAEESPNQPGTRHIRIFAAAAAAAGAAVTTLEIKSLLRTDMSAPGGSWFWLLIGIAALIFGTAEIFLNGRDIPKKR